MTWRGVLQLRVVDELPPVLRVLPEGATDPLHVVTADEVEQRQPSPARDRGGT
jgi:hypothetical protein